MHLGRCLQLFTELRAWQRAHALALEIYRLTSSFPKAELFGLVSQMRRAAVSIAANLAEGSKRTSGAEYARFVNIAEGSAAELQCLLLLAGDLGLALKEDVRTHVEELNRIMKMLLGLRRAITLAQRRSEANHRR